MRSVLTKGAMAIAMLIVICPAFSQTSSKAKKALIIGIGKNKAGTGWPAIHGDNDVELMQHALQVAGFDAKNIHTLKNEEATKAGIVDALNQLIAGIAAGDIIVLHYSGHGQQLTDIDGDEPDGLDEALAPYDAPATETDPAYKGDKHLTDDELAIWFNKIREKTGPSGQLIVFIDACHSGTVSKGNGLVRGTMPPLRLNKTARKGAGDNSQPKGSGYLQSTGTGNQPGQFVLFTATRAEEPNYEYNERELGSLSFAVADAFENKLRSPQSSFRDLFEYVRNTMAVIVPSQNPQLEGDMDTKLFGGDIIVQEPFYRVLGLNPNGWPEINGGRIMGLSEGTEIGFFPIGTRTSAGKPIIKGKLAETGQLRSVVQTDRKIGRDSIRQLQAFVLSPVFDNAQTKVYIQTLSPALTNKLKEELPKRKIKLVTSRTDATLIIDVNNKGLVEIQNAEDRTPIVNAFDANTKVPVLPCGSNTEQLVDPADYMISTISGYARNNVIKKTTFGDREYQLSIRMISTDGEADVSPAFNTVSSKAVLRVYNTGSYPGYIYLVELDPSGKICPVMGFRTETRVNPGDSAELRIRRFAPPYGRYVIKGYITEEPIRDELNWLIAEQSSTAAPRGSNSKLISLISGLMQNPGKPRSGDADKSGGASITNYAYDIYEK